MENFLEKNSVILVGGFFRNLVNKKLCRKPFFRYSSEFQYLGFRYSSRHLYKNHFASKIRTIMDNRFELVALPGGKFSLQSVNL